MDESDSLYSYICLIRQIKKKGLNWIKEDLLKSYYKKPCNDKIDSEGFGISPSEN